jgi:hypothetical protein
MTKGKINVGMWFSVFNGIGERSNINGDSTFNCQTTEQFRKVEMHVAHRKTRVVGK